MRRRTDVVKICMVKQSNQYGNPMLVPMDAEAMERLSKLSDDHQLIIEYKRNRSTRQHRLFWKMMNLVFENLPERYAYQFKNVNGIEKYIVGQCGRSTVITNRNGEVWMMPDSIAYDAMDQDDFSDLFEKAVTFIVNEIIPGIDRDSFRSEIMSLVG